MKKLFKNGVIVDKTKTSKEDVLVVNGKIEQIGKDLKYDDAEIIDLKGQALMPAFIDMHSHFRDPGYTYKEDNRNESKCKRRLQRCMYHGKH